MPSTRAAELRASSPALASLSACLPPAMRLARSIAVYGCANGRRRSVRLRKRVQRHLSADDTGLLRTPCTPRRGNIAFCRQHRLTSTAAGSRRVATDRHRGAYAGCSSRFRRTWVPERTTITREGTCLSTHRLHCRAIALGYFGRNHGVAPGVCLRSSRLWRTRACCAHWRRATTYLAAWLPRLQHFTRAPWRRRSNHANATTWLPSVAMRLLRALLPQRARKTSSPSLRTRRMVTRKTCTAIAATQVSLPLNAAGFASR
jgi:hypothetical protein